MIATRPTLLTQILVNLPISLYISPIPALFRTSTPLFFLSQQKKDYVLRQLRQPQRSADRLA